VKGHEIVVVYKGLEVIGHDECFFNATCHEERLYHTMLVYITPYVNTRDTTSQRRISDVPGSEYKTIDGVEHQDGMVLKYQKYLKRYRP
jgi:hypothetical protein